MDKPFTIQVQETEEEIIKIINNSKLPAYVLKIIFKELYQQIDQIELDEIEKYQNKKKKGSDK